MTPSDLDVVDIQGLSWSSTNVTRAQYRSARVTEYMSIERAKGIPILHTDRVYSEDTIYEFRYMNKMEANTCTTFSCDTCCLHRLVGVSTIPVIVLQKTLYICRHE